jgi:hypothetical protein
MKRRSARMSGVSATLAGSTSPSRTKQERSAWRVEPPGGRREGQYFLRQMRRSLTSLDFWCRKNHHLEGSQHFRDMLKGREIAGFGVSDRVGGRLESMARVWLRRWRAVMKYAHK